MERTERRAHLGVAELIVDRDEGLDELTRGQRVAKLELLVVERLGVGVALGSERAELRPSEAEAEARRTVDVCAVALHVLGEV